MSITRFLRMFKYEISQQYVNNTPAIPKGLSIVKSGSKSI